MGLYDDLVGDALKNIEHASDVSGKSLATSTVLVAMAQVRATLALAEALRNPKPKPHNLPPL